MEFNAVWLEEVTRKMTLRHLYNDLYVKEMNFSFVGFIIVFSPASHSQTEESCESLNYVIFLILRWNLHIEKIHEKKK